MNVEKNRVQFLLFIFEYFLSSFFSRNYYANTFLFAPVFMQKIPCKYIHFCSSYFAETTTQIHSFLYAENTLQIHIFLLQFFCRNFYANTFIFVCRKYSANTFIFAPVFLQKLPCKYIHICFILAVVVMQLKFLTVNCKLRFISSTVQTFQQLVQALQYTNRPSKPKRDNEQNESLSFSEIYFKTVSP